MNSNSEKHDLMAVAEVSAGIQQLKLQTEQTALELTRYKHDLQRNYDEKVRRNDISQLMVILEFIASAPAHVLRKLSEKLQRLTRKLVETMHKVQWRLPRSLVGDVIRFEDALGRQINLPYAYFKHWIVLKPFLTHIFRDFPGEYQVRRNQYRLFHHQNGRQLHPANWERKVRPGEHVSMSVVSTSPFDTASQLSCPFCDTASPVIQRKGQVIMCRRCNAAYQASTGSFYYHVTPSDGDYNVVSMLTGKEIALSSGESQVTNEQFGVELNEEESDMLFEKSTRLPRSNVGVSNLKNVVLSTSANPINVANCIEDLLDQLITASNQPEFSTEMNVHRLHNAHVLLRDEASRTTELNYFDFKAEHSAYMSLACGVFTGLRQRLDELKHNNQPSSSTIGVLTTYSNWIMDHYPQRCRSPTGLRLWHILILVRTLTGALHCFRVPPDLTIAELKDTIQLRTGVPVLQQYLVCRGRKLEDTRTVADYNLNPQFQVHILLPIWSSTKVDPFTGQSCSNERVDWGRERYEVPASSSVSQCNHKAEQNGRKRKYGDRKPPIDQPLRQSDIHGSRDRVKRSFPQKWHGSGNDDADFRSAFQPAALQRFAQDISKEDREALGRAAAEALARAAAQARATRSHSENQ